MNDKSVLIQVIRKYGIMCGIAGPGIYAFIVILLGFLQPGFNHITQFMSELGETGAPYAVIMNLAGFALIGTFLIIFAARFYLEFAGIRGATPSSLLLALTGVLYLGEAYFPCDAGCVPVTGPGLLHLELGQVSVFVAVLAAFVIDLCPQIFEGLAGILAVFAHDRNTGSYSDTVPGLSARYYRFTPTYPGRSYSALVGGPGNQNVSPQQKPGFHYSTLLIRNLSCS